MLPIKLNRLLSQVPLEVLPEKLVFRTSYFNSIREIIAIVPLYIAEVYRSNRPKAQQICGRVSTKLSGASLRSLGARSLAEACPRMGKTSAGSHRRILL